MHEGDEPEVLADLGDPYILSRKHLTEVALRPLKQIRPHRVTAIVWS